MSPIMETNAKKKDIYIFKYVCVTELLFPASETETSTQL